MKIGLLLAWALPLTQFAQLDAPPPKPTQHVVYASEQQVIGAGKREMLELRFRVDDGFHVNSHQPKSELLMPTTVEFQPADGVKLEAAEYPAGKVFSFAFDPAEKLDVYSDQFTVKLPVIAARGTHDLKGVLRYQACDRAACYPAKTLAVDVLFAAK